MVNYHEILRLNAQGYSQRQIASSARSSRNTVKETIEAAERQGITTQSIEGVSNKELEAMLFSTRVHGLVHQVQPDYGYIHKELAKPGVTLTLLWQEYCASVRSSGDDAKPYMYTQFCEKYRVWARTTRATMRIQHKPGDAMQVDWAGGTIPYYDAMTGSESAAYMFVAVLPCSCYAYAEACVDMKTESWLSCHINAYTYFGGVTRLLIPDNLKTGIVKNTRNEIVYNQSYHELAEYYQTAIVPTRVKHPQDKGLVEGTVKHVSTWIIAALRNQKFFTLEQVREAVSEKLTELNDRPFQKRDGSRKSAYLSEEQEFMRPLPGIAYELATWSQATVGNDYLISDGRNKYSVPFDLIGEQVNIRVTKAVVEVFFKSSRVASHKREYGVKRDPIVVPTHMPTKHRAYLSYNADDFMAWAKTIGEKTAEVVSHFLKSGLAPEQGFKQCASLRKLAERYGAECLESACLQVLSYAVTPSLRTITAVLKNQKSSSPSASVTSKVTSKASSTSAHPQKSYGITRGAEYFNNGGDGQC